MFSVYISGTDTGIGKTLASSALLHALRGHGLRAIGMKPVASGCDCIDGEWKNADALALQAAGQPGIAYAGKQMLEFAVVLLGASISGATILAAGPALLVGIALVVALALSASFMIGKAMGLPWKMATLIACGNSICGNSAIAAVAHTMTSNNHNHVLHNRNRMINTSFPYRLSAAYRRAPGHRRSDLCATLV